MKTTFSTILFLISFVGFCFSQSKSVDPSISTGITLYENGGKTGYNLNGNLLLKTGTYTGIRFGLGLNSFPSSGSSSNYVQSRVCFSAGDYREQSEVQPYGFAGFGADFVITSGNSEPYFGLSFGGGIRVKISPKLRLFGEFQYNVLATKGLPTYYYPIRFGLVF